MDSKSKNRTTLEKRVKEKIKTEFKTIEAGALSGVGMSTSGMHSSFYKHETMRTEHLQNYAKFLDVSFDQAKEWNDEKITDIPDILLAISDNTSIDKETQSNKHNYKFVIYGLIFTCLTLIVLISYILNNTGINVLQFDREVANYTGSSADLSVANIPSEQFNNALYTYRLDDLVIEKYNNGKLSFITNLTVKLISSDKVLVTGLMTGEGYYIGDQASVSYRVLEVSNGESWTGVFMFDLPNTGQATGYWLTSHNDSNTAGGYKYAIGNVTLKRSNE